MFTKHFIFSTVWDILKVSHSEVLLQIVLFDPGVPWTILHSFYEAETCYNIIL